MAKNFAQNKGARAEREAIKLLTPVVTEIYSKFGMEQPRLQRNSMQADGGGSDIAGLEWMALEIKHQETLNVNQWWEQCVGQVKVRIINGKEVSQVPVLMYKRNNVKWRVMMHGLLRTGGEQNIVCPCDIPMESFLLYFRHKLIKELTE
jgi:hypothetical protein